MMKGLVISVPLGILGVISFTLSKQASEGDPFWLFVVGGIMIFGVLNVLIGKAIENFAWAKNLDKTLKELGESAEAEEPKKKKVG
jgi:drug/metabolite transporter (DMT)-like permease